MYPKLQNAILYKRAFGAVMRASKFWSKSLYALQHSIDQFALMVSEDAIATAPDKATVATAPPPSYPIITHASIWIFRHPPSTPHTHIHIRTPWHRMPSSDSYIPIVKEIHSVFCSCNACSTCMTAHVECEIYRSHFDDLFASYH